MRGLPRARRARRTTRDCSCAPPRRRRRSPHCRAAGPGAALVGLHAASEAATKPPLAAAGPATSSRAAGRPVAAASWSGPALICCRPASSAVAPAATSSAPVASSPLPADSLRASSARGTGTGRPSTRSARRRSAACGAGGGAGERAVDEGDDEEADGGGEEADRGGEEHARQRGHRIRRERRRVCGGADGSAAERTGLRRNRRVCGVTGGVRPGEGRGAERARPQRQPVGSRCGDGRDGQDRRDDGQRPTERGVRRHPGAQGQAASCREQAEQERDCPFRSAAVRDERGDRTGGRAEQRPGGELGPSTAPLVRTPTATAARPRTCGTAPRSTRTCSRAGGPHSRRALRSTHGRARDAQEWGASRHRSRWYGTPFDRCGVARPRSPDRGCRGVVDGSVKAVVAQCGQTEPAVDNEL